MKLSNILTVLCIASASICHAQATANAEAALSDLNNIGGSAPTFANGLSNVFTYPPVISGNCTYCSYAWGRLCFRHGNVGYSWTFSAISNFVNNFNVDNRILIGHVSSFQNYYQPLRTWFISTLPNLNRQLTTAAGTSTVLEQLQLDAAIADVQSTHAQLTAATASLTQWSNMVAADLATMQNLNTTMEAALNAEGNNVNAYSGGMKCGGSELVSQYNGVNSAVQSQMNNYLAGLQRFGISTSNINNDFANILGPIATMESELNGVKAELVSGKLTPNAVMQRFHIIVAKADLQALISYAQGQL